MQRTETATGATPALQKSAHEIIRVTTHEYQGATMVSARVWYVNRRGEQRPSRRGLTVPPDVWRALLPLIAEELDRLPTADPEVRCGGS